jgi:hypothetical protein
MGSGLALRAADGRRGVRRGGDDDGRLGVDLDRVGRACAAGASGLSLWHIVSKNEIMEYERRNQKAKVEILGE